MGKNYEDTILLKIKRTYSKDESVMFLVNQLKKSKTIIGQYKSEVAHLKNRLNNKEQLKDKEKAKLRKEYVNSLELDPGIKKKMKLSNLLGSIRALTRENERLNRELLKLHSNKI